jgi:hypothetical protein
MAEIKIEKKKPVWPWILLVLILAAVIYFFVFRDKEAEQDVIEEVQDTTSMIEAPAGSRHAEATYYTNWA